MIFLSPNDTISFWDSCDVTEYNIVHLQISSPDVQMYESSSP